MANTLVIGYGNADRQDDGAGWHVVKILAERIGRTTPDDPGEPIEIESEFVDILFTLQIYPELAETISHYEKICFVDAHTSEIPDEISWTKLSPEYEKSPLTHHMSPKTVLSIASTIYNRNPETILVSIRGYYFQFERTLSQQTSELVKIASNRIWDWIKNSS